MLGNTPPLAIVTEPSSLLNSSSFFTANWMCLGMILFFLLSLAAFPANSKTYQIHKQNYEKKLINCKSRFIISYKRKKKTRTNLSSKVFKDGGEIDGRAGSDALGVSAFLEEASDTANWELETGLVGSGHRFRVLGPAPPTLGCCSFWTHGWEMGFSFEEDWEFWINSKRFAMRTWLGCFWFI